MASELHPSKTVKIGDFQVKDIYKRFFYMSDTPPVRRPDKAFLSTQILLCKPNRFAVQRYNIILD